MRSNSAHMEKHIADTGRQTQRISAGWKRENERRKKNSVGVPPAALFSRTDDTQLHSATCSYLYECVCVYNVSNTLAKEWILNVDSRLVSEGLTIPSLPLPAWVLLFFSYSTLSINPHQSDKYGVWLFFAMLCEYNTFGFRKENMGVLYTHSNMGHSSIYMHIDISGWYVFFSLLLSPLSESFRFDCNNI